MNNVASINFVCVFGNCVGNFVGGSRYDMFMFIFYPMCVYVWESQRERERNNACICLCFVECLSIYY